MENGDIKEEEEEDEVLFAEEKWLKWKREWRTGRRREGKEEREGIEESEVEEGELEEGEEEVRVRNWGRREGKMEWEKGKEVGNWKEMVEIRSSKKEKEKDVGKVFNVGSEREKDDAWNLMIRGRRRSRLSKGMLGQGERCWV